LRFQFCSDWSDGPVCCDWSTTYSACKVDLVSECRKQCESMSTTQSELFQTLTVWGQVCLFLLPYQHLWLFSWRDQCTLLFKSF